MSELRKRKINTGLNYFTIDDVKSKSKMYRKFPQELDALLHPHHFKNNEAYIKNTYIQRTDTKNELMERLSNEVDEIIFLLGYTGSGKSTFIVNTFNILNDNVKCHSETGEVTLCMYWNNEIINVKEDFTKKFTAKITSMRQAIIKTYGVLIESFSEADPGFMGLYHFIKENKPSLLGSGTEFKVETPVDELSALFKENKLAFEIEYIKYACNVYKVKSIIIIVDDIESHTDAVIKKLMERMFHVFLCLENNEDRTYKVKVIIAERFLTFRELQKNRLYETIRPFKYEIYIEPLDDLDKLFTMRFEVMLRELNIKRINRDSLDEAIKALRKFSGGLHEKFSVTILRLNNFNISKSLKDFQKIIQNRMWIEHGSNIEDKFSIKVDDYYKKITIEKVIKALACGESQVYVDDKRAIINNLLYNEEEDGFELLTLLVIKYFFHSSDLSDCINEKALYENTKYIEYDVLIDNFCALFRGCDEEARDKITNRLQKVLRNLRECEVLLIPPQINDLNNDGYDYYEEFAVANEVGDGRMIGKYLYISPKGKELWRLFTDTSILFELFREDIFMDDRSFKFVKSDDLSKKDLFEENMSYYKYLFDVERNLIAICNGGENVAFYFTLFGDDLISEYLVRSLKKSIDIYYEREGVDYLDLLSMLRGFEASVVKYKTSILERLN